MQTLSPPLNLSVMARKEVKPKTSQINFRFRDDTIDLMEKFQVEHPLRPTLTMIAEAAVLEYIARQNAEKASKHPKR